MQFATSALLALAFSFCQVLTLAFLNGFPKDQCDDMDPTKIKIDESMVKGSESDMNNTEGLAEDLPKSVSLSVSLNLYKIVTSSSKYRRGRTLDSEYFFFFFWNYNYETRLDFFFFLFHFIHFLFRQFTLLQQWTFFERSFYVKHSVCVISKFLEVKNLYKTLNKNFQCITFFDSWFLKVAQEKHILGNTFNLYHNFFFNYWRMITNSKDCK